MGKFLSHQIKVNTQIQSVTPTQLSDHDHSIVHTVLPLLIEQSHRWKMLHESNDISATKQFAYDLRELAEEYQFDILLEYSSSFLACLNTFDIEGIRQKLSEFPQLINTLEQY